jgi:hypothetical protein
MSDEKWTTLGREAIQIVRHFLTEMNLAPEEVPFEHGAAFRVSLDGPAEQGLAQIHADIERFAFIFMFPN